MTIPHASSFRQVLCSAVFKLWPFSFGHVRLMETFAPGRLMIDSHVRKLRGLPVKLKYNPNSYIGRYIYYRGLFEEPIIQKMISVIQLSDVFLDIGANIGQHTVVGAHCVGPGGRVIAIEPQLEVYNALCHNIQLNGFSNVTPIRCVLGRTCGHETIYKISVFNDGQATLARPPQTAMVEAELVNAYTIQDALEMLDVTQVDVIKLDVEGAEMEVLQGSRDFLRRFAPRCMFIESVESNLRKFGSSAYELNTWLTMHGYDIKALVHGRWLRFQPERHHAVDLFATRR